MTEALLEKLYHLALTEAGRLPLAIMLLLMFLAAVLQVVVPPVPGDIALPTAGALSVVLAYKFFGVEYYLCFWLGTVTALIFIFELGRAKGEKVLGWRFFKKFFSDKTMKRARGFLQAHGGAVLLVSKFILGTNTPVVALAGTMKVRRRVAYPAMAAASFVQNGLLFMPGRWLGNNHHSIAVAMSSIGMGGLVLLLLLLGFIFLFYNRLSKRRKERTGIQ